MNTDLPIWIVEPEQAEKRELAAQKLFQSGPKAAHISETASIDELKGQIRKLRENARDNLKSLVRQLETTLSNKYPTVRVTSAVDYIEAVNYITRNSNGIRTISTNNSSTVQELKSELANSGFTLVNSYHHEFDLAERKILDYWDLPRLLDKNLTSTFDVAIKMGGIPALATKNYLALLGVNAISAEDGTALFLEHFANIHKDLLKASKVILIVGLDKIVETKEEAIFQTLCMGIFGMESVLLGIGPKPAKLPGIDEMPLPGGDGKRELHIIILDNGRSKLLDTKFRDLFLCIGCRACNKHCPIRHSFVNADYIWTPKIYLNQFVSGTGQSIDVCLHCEACRMECPVDIDLPYLMWQAKLDYIARHGTPFSYKILGRPEWLARLGTIFAPAANWLVGQKRPRIALERIAGIDRRTNLPRFHLRTFRKSLNKNGRWSDSK